LTLASDGREMAAEPHGPPEPTAGAAWQPVSDDALDDLLPPQPARAIIGQITHHLSHMSAMVYAADEARDDYHRRIAFVDSFLLDFRALYNFLLGPEDSKDAHRYYFVDKKTWPRPKTEATKRMRKLALFMGRHRAHLSWGRFVPTDQDLELLVGIPRLDAEFLGWVLLDFLDILDDFISKLPDDKESGQRAWISAAMANRYKTEVALGVREPDITGKWKPLKSVQEQHLAD
jgi:hypothetical protein